MQKTNQQVILGKISAVFGIKGWLKVYSYTAPLEAILDYPEWQLEKNGVIQTCQFSQGKKHGKGIVVLLKGISDRNQAEEYIGNIISVDRSLLPKVDKGQYYWADLEGLRVKTSAQVELGVLDYLFETGSNDVMSVKGDKTRLIPYLDDVVLEVDLQEGVITVDWDPDF